MRLRRRSPLGPGFGIGRRVDRGVPSLMWCSDSRWKWLPYSLADLICAVVNGYYCRRYGHDWLPHHSYRKSEQDGQWHVGRYLYDFCTRCSRRWYREGLRADWPMPQVSA